MKKSAFTLIEFLIALVIIGFIVAILVGVFSSPVHDARIGSQASAMMDAYRQVADSWRLYEARTGSQPLVGGCATADANINKLVAEGYLTAVPAVAGLDDGVAFGPLTYNYCSGAGLQMNFGGCNAVDGGAACYDTAFNYFLAPDGSRDDLCARINENAGAKRTGVPTCANNHTGDPADAMDGPESGSSALQCCQATNGWRVVFGQIALDTGTP